MVIAGKGRGKDIAKKLPVIDPKQKKIGSEWLY